MNFCYFFKFSSLFFFAEGVSDKSQKLALGGKKEELVERGLRNKHPKQKFHKIMSDSFFSFLQSSPSESKGRKSFYIFIRKDQKN